MGRGKTTTKIKRVLTGDTNDHERLYMQDKTVTFLLILVTAPEIKLENSFNLKLVTKFDCFRSR